MGQNEVQGLDIDYDIILKYYSIEEVKERFGIWYSDAKRFLDKKGLSDQAVINTSRLGYAICDYFVDMIRMKEFHGIEHANLNKVYAYSCYWFVRRQPIQLVGDVEDGDLYINELFAVNNLIAKLRRHSSNADIIHKQSLLDLGKLWLYNFKFRVFTAQSLETAICSFFVANGNRSVSG
ncbi:MAG: hypothetical protein IJ567_09580 [Lachnospiraceae bacterium]|nr:hypothetical protein [Lachnospiraceae bacterium]